MKIAVFDLETTGLHADFGVLLAAVVKPLGGRAKTFRIDQYTCERRSDDSLIVKDVIEELRGYDILIAHNGKRFDQPFLNARALRWGLEPLAPTTKFIDPVLIARKHLTALSSKSLVRLSEHLDTRHRKTPVDGQMWVRASIDRDKEALDYVVDHCAKDVLVLEEVYTALKGFVTVIGAYGG